MPANPLESLAKSLFNSLPDSFQHIEEDIEQRFKDVLQAAFAKMELVTRDEFDVQVKVLARTRQKLDALEQQIEQMNKEKKS